MQILRQIINSNFVCAYTHGWAEKKLKEDIKHWNEFFCVSAEMQQIFCAIAIIRREAKIALEEIEQKCTRNSFPMNNAMFLRSV